MKGMISSVLMVLLFGMLAACAPTLETAPADEAEGEDQLAQAALGAFLEHLQAGRYDEAVPLYGGSYETMIYHNPSVEPSDHAALLRNACTVNGVQCLAVREARLEAVGEGEWVFAVSFEQEDGTLFVLGPCCGGSATDFPPESVFSLRVARTSEGEYVVLDMPPYVP